MPTKQSTRRWLSRWSLRLAAYAEFAAAIAAEAYGAALIATGVGAPVGLALIAAGIGLQAGSIATFHQLNKIQYNQGRISQSQYEADKKSTKLQYILLGPSVVVGGIVGYVGGKVIGKVAPYITAFFAKAYSSTSKLFGSMTAKFTTSTLNKGVTRGVASGADDLTEGLLENAGTKTAGSGSQDLVSKTPSIASRNSSTVLEEEIGQLDEIRLSTGNVEAKETSSLRISNSANKTSASSFSGKVTGSKSSTIPAEKSSLEKMTFSQKLYARTFNKAKYDREILEDKLITEMKTLNKSSPRYKYLDSLLIQTMKAEISPTIKQETSILKEIFKDSKNLTNSEIRNYYKALKQNEAEVYAARATGKVEYLNYLKNYLKNYLDPRLNVIDTGRETFDIPFVNAFLP